MFIINQNVFLHYSLLRSTSSFIGRQVTLHEIYLLEEVLFAEQLAIAGKAFVIQLGMAFATLQALGVPSPLQHLQYETVQDELMTASALRYCGCNKTTNPFQLTGNNSKHFTLFHFSIDFYFKVASGVATEQDCLIVL